MRVATYSRVSTQHREQKPEVQVQELRRYYKVRGFKINGLSANELARFLPDFARRPGPVQESALKSHFDVNVSSARCAAIPGSTEAERVEVARQVESLVESETNGGIAHDGT